MKNSLVLCFVMLLSIFHLTKLHADQHAASNDRAKPGFGWLGVVAAPLSDELRAQLSALVPTQEGVLVEWVEQDSPADRAGIRQYDVVVSFAGQKIYSPDQLSNLVRYSNPTSEIEIQLIQQGRPISVTTNLAQRQPRVLGRTKRPPYFMPPRPRQPPPLAQPYSAWDSFESIRVQTLENGRYRAEVSFRDRNNETISFTFEGNKQEIVAQIRQQQDLPADKQRALLQALDLRPDQIGGYRSYGYLEDLLKSPWLSTEPFDHPFFRNPYYLDRYYYPPWRQPPWQLHLYPELPQSD